MSGLIKIIFSVILIIWFLSSEYAQEKIGQIQNFINLINENVISHLSIEVKTLLVIFIFAIIFIFIKRFYYGARD